MVLSNYKKLIIILKNMNKKILYILLIIIIVLIGLIIFSQSKNQAANSSFLECLKDSGVVIYGTGACPTCTQLKNDLLAIGEDIDLVYVDCDENSQRCAEETKENNVPEIQIKGNVFPNNSIEALSQETGCKIN